MFFLKCLNKKTLLFVITITILSVTPMQAEGVQQFESRLEKRTYANEPLKIVDLRVGSKELQFDEDFLGDTDWITKVEVKLKNTSTLQITHLQINLQLPQGKESALSVPFAIAGSPTHLPEVQPTFQLNPGDTLILKFNSKFLQKLKEKAAQIGHRELNRLILSIERVVFSDNTLWQYGYIHRRNSNNPLQWDAVRDDLPLQKSSLILPLSLTRKQSLLSTSTVAANRSLARFNCIAIYLGFTTFVCGYYDSGVFPNPEKCFGQRSNFAFTDWGTDQVYVDYEICISYFWGGDYCSPDEYLIRRPQSCSGGGTN